MNENSDVHVLDQLRPASAFGAAVGARGSAGDRGDPAGDLTGQVIDLAAERRRRAREARSKQQRAVLARFAADDQHTRWLL